MLKLFDFFGSDQELKLSVNIVKGYIIVALGTFFGDVLGFSANRFKIAPKTSPAENERIEKSPNSTRVDAVRGFCPLKTNIKNNNFIARS